MDHTGSEDMKKGHKDALVVTGIYTVFGVTWILFSDWLLFRVAPDLEAFVYFSVVKGLVYVAISAAVIFSVLMYQHHRNEALSKRLSTREESGKRFAELLSMQKQLLFNMVDESPLPVMLHTENKEVVRLSKHFTERTGYSKTDIPTIRAWVEKAFNRRHDDMYEHIAKTYDIEERVFEGNFTIMTKHRRKLSWDLYSVYIGRDERGLRVIATIAIDLTEQKEREKSLTHLSYHDDLTELYNRRYFNEVSDLYKNKKDVGILLADINGLKLINDVFGHEEGDRILIRFARLLQDNLPKESVIARLGGDEFVAVIQRFNAQHVKEAIRDIKHEIRRGASDIPFLSAAFGYSKKAENHTLRHAFLSAENMLYKDKIHEYNRQTKGVTEALLENLYKRTDETPEHLERLTRLGTRMADRLKLRKHERGELFRLIKLHDIGKISLDKRLFSEAGQYDPELAQEVTRHAEIGYRIANALPKLKNVAYAILTHHEHVDGSGYPFGLKSEEIPLSARIFRILDDYDILVSGTSGEEHTKQEALAKLISHRGTYYDEKLLDVFVEEMED